MSKPPSPLYAVYYTYQPQVISQLVKILSTIQCHITHPQYHHSYFSSQLDQASSHCPGSVPYRITLLASLQNFTFWCSANTLVVSTGKNSLNFLQPHLMLPTMLSSRPLSALIIRNEPQSANLLLMHLFLPNVDRKIELLPTPSLHTEHDHTLVFRSILSPLDSIPYQLFHTMV